MNSTTANQNPIVSLSLNPAIDLSYDVNALAHDQKSRAISTCYDPGGTGINVGRALQILQANATTCYITAGKMGEFLDSMIKQQLNSTFCLKVPGETRINTTIIQSSPSRQYEINATGPSVNAANLEQIIDQFITFCQQGIGILTGSLPPGTSTDTYKKINLKIQQQGGRCIIDAPLEIMKKTLESQPFLIKPNLHELESLQKKQLKTIEQIAQEARNLVTQKSCHNACVSIGKQGAILTTNENSFYCAAPKIKAHSTVGAGDSLVAGLAYAFSCQQPAKDILKLAIACGSGTATYPGTQLFSLSDIQRLSQNLKIKTLNI